MKGPIAEVDKGLRNVQGRLAGHLRLNHPPGGTIPAKIHQTCAITMGASRT
jgi:hypothetical protein